MLALSDKPETSRLLAKLIVRYRYEFGEDQAASLIDNANKYKSFKELPQKQQDQLNYIRKIVGV